MADDFDIGTFGCGDAPELAKRILLAFTDSPADGVEQELRRYLWNSGCFGCAVPLELAMRFVVNDRAGHFVYHQRSQLMFTGVTAHPILMSYLAALHRTDFASSPAHWCPSAIYDWNATARLADEFVEGGLGFYLSAVGGGAISVSPSFVWTPQEKRIFARYPRRDV